MVRNIILKQRNKVMNYIVERLCRAKITDILQVNVNERLYLKTGFKAVYVLALSDVPVEKFRPGVDSELKRDLYLEYVCFLFYVHVESFFLEKVNILQEYQLKNGQSVLER